MISIIITAFKEPRTIQRAISAIGDQRIPNSEILLVAPDDETLNTGKKLIANYKNLKILKDKGQGKPAALNLAVAKAKGEILVLTDGDVYVGENSINLLLQKMQNSNIGAVTGNPISLNKRNTKYGYWAFTLTSTADFRRKRALNLGKRFFCSGYLFAIRKELFPHLPENLLSEDGYISHNVYKKGYKIEYADKAKVFVKYPTNFRDWIIQKKRSAGGYNQIRSMIHIEIRSFRKESSGLLGFFKYIRSPIELIWLINLFFARIYLWSVIYRDINLKNKKREELWTRVESTK